MRASVCRAALAATSALAMFVMTTHAADDCCVPTYPSPYACTVPAPPSRFPPVHIPNPFACDSPYCDPGYGGNPYGRGPIPLPPPPGTGPTEILLTARIHTARILTASIRMGRTLTAPRRSVRRRGRATLTPREGPPIFQHRGRSAGTTQFVEEPQPLCKVSFWNHTAGELTLYVGDRTHRVQRDRAIVLSLPREFSWKTDLHADKREQVPGDLNYFDVVIR